MCDKCDLEMLLAMAAEEERREERRRHMEPIMARRLQMADRIKNHQGPFDVWTGAPISPHAIAKI